MKESTKQRKSSTKTRGRIESAKIRHGSEDLNTDEDSNRELFPTGTEVSTSRKGLRTQHTHKPSQDKKENAKDLDRAFTSYFADFRKFGLNDLNE